MRRAALGVLGVLVCFGVSNVAATAAKQPFGAAAATGGPRELPKLVDRTPRTEANPPDIHAPRLHVGAAYTSRFFPLRLRVTAPAGAWCGGQGRSQDRGKFLFGWIELMQAPSARPRGVLSMITAYGRTPSVGATVARLRDRRPGATYEAVSAVKLAGFAGRQFDGEIVGSHHTFIPFTPKSRAARFYPDAYTLDRGEVFRFVVLNVRGKTVALLFESAALPPEQFEDFLDSANQILGSLRFPH